MKKCLAFILALVCLTVLVVSCTDNNGKDNEKAPGTIIIPVTDEQGETVTNDKGEVETEIKPAPDTEKESTSDTQKETNSSSNSWDYIDTDDNTIDWGPLKPGNNKQ